jgi:rod shape-determining protein MreC
MVGQDTDSSRASTITLVIAFLIAGVFYLSDRGSGRLLTQTTIGAETGFAPVLELLSKPLRAVENVGTGLQERARAVEENRALREELYVLREEKQRAQVMAMKLERFEEILRANSGLDIPAEKIAARAISEVNGPFVRSALLNAGTNKGIKKGHPVMTVSGLYGHVLHAGPHSARVLQLGDLNSRISVMSARSQARAILSGDNSDLPILAFVGDRADWREGDQVVSSGDGGVLPQGLPIGDVKLSDSGQFVVTLGTTGRPTDWVWIYPYEPTKAPEDNQPEDTQPEDNQEDTIEESTGSQTVSETPLDSPQQSLESEGP